MVAGAGWHADVVQAGPGRDRGDQRLRAVPAGHAQDVRSPADRVLGEFPEVIAGFQDHRLDPPLAALAGQAEPLRLTPAGLRVHDQHRVLRPAGPGQPGRVRPQGLVGAAQCVPGGEDRNAGQRGDQEQQRPADMREEQARDGPAQRGRHDQQRDHPEQAAPGYGVPAGGHADQEPDGDGEDGQQVQRDPGQRGSRGTDHGHQGSHGGGPLARGRAIHITACHSVPPETPAHRTRGCRLCCFLPACSIRA